MSQRCSATEIQRRALPREMARLPHHSAERTAGSAAAGEAQCYSRCSLYPQASKVVPESSSGRIRANASRSGRLPSGERACDRRRHVERRDDRQNEDKQTKCDDRSMTDENQTDCAKRCRGDRRSEYDAEAIARSDRRYEAEPGLIFGERERRKKKGRPNQGHRPKRIHSRRSHLFSQVPLDVIRRGEFYRSAFSAVRRCIRSRADTCTARSRPYNVLAVLL